MIQRIDDGRRACNLAHPDFCALHLNGSGFGMGQRDSGWPAIVNDGGAQQFNVESSGKLKSSLPIACWARFCFVSYCKESPVICRSWDFLAQF
jgi:hypothetical protein